MDKRQFLSRQPPLARTFLYGRGIFRLLPAPFFLMAGHSLALGLLEWSLAGSDSCISVASLFFFASFIPLLVAALLCLGGPLASPLAPKRSHFFFAPFLAYGIAGAAIQHWGWGAKTAPECLIRTFPSTALGVLTRDVASAYVNLHTATAVMLLFPASLLAMALAFALPRLFERSSWASFWNGASSALRWIAKAPADAAAALAHKAADSAITQEELAKMERSALLSDCDEGSGSTPPPRL